MSIEPAHLQTPPPPQEPELGFELPPPARPGRLRALALLGLGTTVVAAAFALGWIPRQRAWAELRSGAGGAEAAVLRVQAISPKPVAESRTVTLPGSVLALEETVIAPRTSGYLRRWAVDMGDEVKEGALLAELEVPELEPQIAQANATLAQAAAALVQVQANRDLARTNLERYRGLTPSGVTSQQDLDQRRAQVAIEEANVGVAEAGVLAQKANLRRLAELKSYGRVLAPFAGRVTARMVERGAQVTPSTPLFRLSATDPVRVMVQVPQDLVVGIKLDAPVKVGVREYAGRVFEGRVARTSGALDPASRTMATEVRVPNPAGELMAGMYAQLSLSLTVPRKVLELPASALLNDAHGLRVAVIAADQTVHLVTVQVDRDTGATVEIGSGLTGSERVVRLASAALLEGRRVELVP